MLKRNDEGKLFMGFETAKDIFDEMNNIGDLRTEKGKKGAILFLTRCACTLDTRDARGYDFSFKTTPKTILSLFVNVIPFVLFEIGGRITKTIPKEENICVNFSI